MVALRSTRLAYVIVGTVALVVGYGVMFLGSGAHDVLMGEDGVVEYVGAFGLFAAAALFFAAFMRARGGSYGTIKKLALLALAALFFFGGGEEISWGQRILGIETPEGLSEANVQDELNVHNLAVFDGVFTPERLFQLFWITFGVLIPFACAMSARIQAWLSRWIPILPLWLAWLFVASQLIAEIVSKILTDNPQLYHGAASAPSTRFELTETVVIVLFAVGGLAVFREASIQRAEAGSAPVGPAA